MTWKPQEPLTPMLPTGSEPLGRRHVLRWLSIGGAVLVTGCGGDSSATGGGIDVVQGAAASPDPVPSPTATPASTSGTQSSLAARTTPTGRGVAFGSLEGSPDSLPGRLYGEVFPEPESHFAYYASKGCDHIRLEGAWERLQPRLYGSLGEQLLGHYDDPNNPLRNPVAIVRRDLDMAAKYGLKVILDLCHNYGSRYVGYDGTWAHMTRAQLGSAQVPVDAWIDFCVKVTQAFGNHPAVASIELMNEPHSLPIGNVGWANACQAAITAIRQVNWNVAIVVGGYEWSNAQLWPYLNPTLHTLVDPARNLFWSAHVYFDRDSSGTYGGGGESAPADANVGVARVTPFLNWLNQHGLYGRGHIGEFGAPNRAEWQPVVQNFVQATKQAGLVLTAHQDVAYANDTYQMNLFPTTDSSGRITGADRLVLQSLLS
ncbi:glycoside hydrolase family 5 protein [Sphingomonas bacterium]|uniref:glycoside hydrolase family 5 protein n=1 Tax=Sphingomonas bacterium TaxID=1895847 RepID=UPI001575AC11|nr:cellulase family glycosylhydrolase [Sphingomonas bacterium]